MSGMVPLVHRLPEIAKRETRFAILRGYDPLPDGDYAFMESYCDDPDCDCRRVLITVFCEQLHPNPVATLNYGWESPSYYADWGSDSEFSAKMAGVIVEPFGKQSVHSRALATLFEEILEDPAYKDRLRRHYAQFKATLQAAGVPSKRRQRRRAAAPRLSPAQARKLTFRFRITLQDVAPPIWRLIEVPASYTFWDLHVAIQDAMGWTDSHLHMFEIATGDLESPLRIGSPIDEDYEEDLPIQASWDVRLTAHFRRPGDSVMYEYDFGDSWVHDVYLEAVERARGGQGQPKCLDGERACPPEDCGGAIGYEDLVAAMEDPAGDAYREYVEWLGAPYDPEAFNPRAVRFDDPLRRRRFAYG